MACKSGRIPTLGAKASDPDGTFQLLAYLTHITGNGFAKASVAERRDGAPA
jgi:hypothetical protein